MAGRPKRNWDAEDFICRQCRPITSKSSSPSHSSSVLSLGVNSKRGQVSGVQSFYGPPSNHPRSYPNTGYHQNSPPNARYPHDHPDIHTSASSPPSHSYTPQTQSTGVTFAHYQPHQGGFSTSRPTYSVQDVNSPQHARYTITPHTVSATGITPYPPAFHVSLVSTFYEQTSQTLLSDTDSNPFAHSFPRTVVSFVVVPSHHQFVPNKWWTIPTWTGSPTILQRTCPYVIFPYAGNN